MNLREYYAVSKSISDNAWLIECARNPGERMKPAHVHVLRIVLRQRGIKF